MASPNLHPVVLERFLPSFDIAIDPKWSKTSQGWPVEQIKGGSLSCLLASSGWYASRSARSHLIANNQNIPLDPDFSGLFWNTVSSMANADKLFSALLECLNEMEKLEFEKFRSAAVQISDAFSLGYEIPIIGMDTITICPLGSFPIDQQGLLLQAGVDVLDAILSRYETGDVLPLETKKSWDPHRPLWDRFESLFPYITSDEKESFQLLHNRLTLARIYSNMSASIGLTTQGTVITDLHARALAYLRYYRQNVGASKPFALDTLQQHLIPPPTHFPVTSTKITTSDTTPDTQKLIFSLPPIPPPINSFHMMNRTLLPAPGGLIGTPTYFNSPFSPPKANTRPKPPGTGTAPGTQKQGVIHALESAHAMQPPPPHPPSQHPFLYPSQLAPTKAPFYAENPPTSSHLLHPHPAPEYYTIWHPSVWSLAIQMTLLHSSLFASIPLIEWLACDWDSPSFHHGADTIQFFIQVYNATALWVSADVLTQRSVETQAGGITRCIQLALCLQHMHNFSGVSAIITGLTRDSVARLANAWKMVPGEAINWLRNMQQLMSDEQQYRVYKEAFKSVQNVNAPIVPHLGAHLAELSAMEMNLPKDIDLPHSAPPPTSQTQKSTENGKEECTPPKGFNMRRYRLLHAAIQPLLQAQLRSYFVPVDVSKPITLTTPGKSATPVPPPRPLQSPPESLTGSFSIDPNHWRVVLDTLRSFHYVSEEEREFATEKLMQRSKHLHPEPVEHTPHLGLLDPAVLVPHSPTRSRSKSPRKWVAGVFGRK